jgi:hypothetical protein
MILRRLTQHIKDQNWFAVVLDFFIVVIGVGIALVGQQMVSDRQQHADMERAAPDWQQDLNNDYFYATERLSLSQCRIKRYQDIAAKLLISSDDWKGMPFIASDAARSAESARDLALPLLFHTPHKPFGSATWEAELARGTFNHMDTERRAMITSSFERSKHIDILQGEIYRLEGGLAILAVSTQISMSDRQAYYNMLGKLDGMGFAIETEARQLINEIEEIGYYDVMTPEERASSSVFLADWSEKFLAVQGDCFQPPTWTFFKMAAAEVPEL